jgi:outer membrane protein OmpA-like peptidoglycan-associated protein
MRGTLMVVAAAFVVLGAAACGGGHSAKSSSSRHGTRSSPSTSASSTTSAGRTPVVPTFGFYADGADGLEPIRISILDVRRSGPFVTLDFSYQCATTSGCDVVDDFLALNNQIGDTPVGVRLVDPVNDVDYQPVTDSHGRVYGSKLVPTSFAEPSQPPRLAWVKFAAPSASVKTVDVLFPQGGPQISDVPVTTGPAPTPASVGGTISPAVPSAFARSPDSTNTSGLNMGVTPLTLKVGSPAQSTSQSASETTVTLSADVLFHFDKASLTSVAHSEISALAAKLKADSTGVVRVAGYTDSIGSDAVNLPLSRRRADAVAAALRTITGQSVRYRTAGFGSADPVAPNTTRSGADDPAGRRLNRRVTVSYHAARRSPASGSQSQTGTQSTTSTQAGGTLSTTFRVRVKASTASTYRVSTSSLYRVGNLVALRFTLKCLATSDPSSGCDDEDFMGDPRTVPPLTLNQLITATLVPGAAYNHAGGIYLTNPATREDYNPVGAGDEVLAAALDANDFGKQSTALWAYFPAPPASATSMTVVMPGGRARIANVPIAPSPPPLTDTGSTVPPLPAGAAGASSGATGPATVTTEPETGGGQ